jgi:hypothetical protein
MHVVHRSVQSSGIYIPAAAECLVTLSSALFFWNDKGGLLYSQLPYISGDLLHLLLENVLYHDDGRPT